MNDLGKILMIIGGLLLLVGGFIWLGGGRFLRWFGRLPGDIRIEKPGMSFYMPLVSMILISLLLSVLLWIVRKFL